MGLHIVEWVIIFKATENIFHLSSHDALAKEKKFKVIDLKII